MFVFAVWTICKGEPDVRIHPKCFGHVLEITVYMASSNDTLYFAVNIIQYRDFQRSFANQLLCALGEASVQVLHLWCSFGS